MADTTQKQYRQDVLQLANSLVIKSKATAEAQNNFYLSFFKLDFRDTPMVEWPYYRHLAGEYVEGVDTVMKVISLDTLEEIEFTYDNLLIHRATAKGYAIGTDYYNTLVNKYPDSLNLIRGILNPVAKNFSTMAEDFTILNYDVNLVESNETNLIPELQTWINKFKHRHYMGRWSLTQSFYDGAFIIVFINMIVKQIMVIREANCNTQYVHSYHLWAYLGSHNRLHVYRDYLTLNQALWLYRNITAIENNAGKTETFQELIEHILTERNIPLTSYEIWHNVKDIPNMIEPIAEMAKLPLNAMAESSLGVEKSTIAALLAKEIPLARDNIDYYEAQTSAIPLRARSTYVNVLPTKALESEMVDRSDATPVKLLDTIFNQWVFLTADNRYQAAVTIENPKTQEVISLTAKDALILWVYCILREYEQPIGNIPTLLAQGVSRVLPPTYQELRSISDVDYISRNMILVALTEHTPVGTIVARETFYSTCNQIHNNRLAHRILYSTQDNPKVRGYLEGLCLRFYFDKRVKLVDEPMSFDTWLVLKELDFSDATRLEMAEFGELLFATSTGINLRNIASLKEIQSAMIGIMTQLSSYSVQYLKKINDGPLTVPDNLGIRFGLEAESGKDSHKVDVGIRFSDQWKEHGKTHVETEMIRAVDFNQIATRATLSAGLTSGIDFYLNQNVVTHHQIYIPGVRFSVLAGPGIGEMMTEHGLMGLRLEYVYSNPIQDKMFTHQLSGLALELMEGRKSLDIVETKLPGLPLFYMTDQVELPELFPNPALRGFTI